MHQSAMNHPASVFSVSSVDDRLPDQAEACASRRPRFSDGSRRALASALHLPPRSMALQCTNHQ
jgi:hypothetical protein